MEDITTQVSLSLGDSYYVDENFDEAADAYAAALSVVRENESDLHIRALSHRSSAFYKLGRYEEAMEDATTALAILSQGPSGLRRGEGELCHKRQGLAFLKLQNYTEAKEAFVQAARLAVLNNRPDGTYLKLISQCDDHLTPSEKDPAVDEGNTTARMEVDSPEAAPSAAVAPALPPTSVACAATKRISTSRPTMPKYQYYQSDQVMTISILEPGVVQENLRVKFESKRLTVILRKGGVDFTVIAGYLYSKIDVEKSKTVIKEEKVLIKLRKLEKFEWHELFGKADDEEDTARKEAPKQNVDDVAPNPTGTKKTRPYASHRDWDAIEKDLEQQEKKEKPEGDEALNALFQQIYGNADDDTRRAMIKSYQTSGGTVLSTNWDEVSKKNYEEERTAPQGMEWKTWEGNKLPMKEDD